MAFFLVPLLDPRINQRSSLVVLYGAFSHHHPPQLRYLNQRLQTHGPGAELDRSPWETGVLTEEQIETLRG